MGILTKKPKLRRFITITKIKRYLLHMRKNDITDIRGSIINGLEISFQRLIQEKRKNNSELVFAQNGKIIKIKASDL